MNKNEPNGGLWQHQPGRARLLFAHNEQTTSTCSCPEPKHANRHTRLMSHAIGRVAAWAVHALCARRPCESRTMSENVSTADLSQRYGSPYAERGHVCVRCMVLCVAERVRGGRGVRPHARGGRRVLEGPLKGDSLHTHFSFAFWTICRHNTS